MAHVGIFDIDNQLTHGILGVLKNLEKERENMQIRSYTKLYADTQRVLEVLNNHGFSTHLNIGGERGCSEYITATLNGRFVGQVRVSDHLQTPIVYYLRAIRKRSGVPIPTTKAEVSAFLKSLKGA